MTETASQASPALRSRRFAVALLVSVAVAANGMFVANLVFPLFEHWRLGLGVAPYWPGHQPFFGTGWLTAWLVGGLVPAIALSVVLSTGQVNRAWFRGLSAILGLGCLTLLVTTLWFRPSHQELGLTLEELRAHPDIGAAVPVPVLHLVGLGAGLAAACALTLGKVRAPVRPPYARWGLVAAATCALVALGWPTLRETAAEYRSQELPEFTIELVAAYPYQTDAAPGTMRAVVVDENGQIGEVIEDRGRRFNIHRGNALRITSEQVLRVRWFDGRDSGGPYISIRLDNEAAAAARTRSRKRMSMHDALFVNGELAMVPLYEDVVVDRLWLHDADAAEQRRLYELLTARAP